MKNLSGVLNVVLLAAVAVLFYLVLGNKNTTEEPVKEVTLPSVSATGLSVAYINMDTLQVYYNRFKNLREDFLKEAKQAEQILIKKQEGFQQSVALFEQQAPKMSQAEFERYRADLEQTRQRVLMEQQQMEQTLMAKEQEMMVEMQAEVDSVLAMIKIENNLDFVFSYPQGSGLLYANDKYDITALVTEKLNALRPTEVDESED